jgi:hypothetical protein
MTPATALHALRHSIFCVWVVYRYSILYLIDSSMINGMAAVQAAYMQSRLRAALTTAYPDEPETVNQLVGSHVIGKLAGTLQLMLHKVLLPGMWWGQELLANG